MQPSQVEYRVTLVETTDLSERAQIVWRIGEEEEVSEACLRLQGLMASAVINGRNALSVMAEVGSASTPIHPFLMTALKRNSLDICEIIKQIDNLLRDNGSGLTQLLEVVETDHSELRWRDLIALRNVLTFRLLTAEGEGTIQSEAKRDFAMLCELLGRLFFVPVRTDFVRSKCSRPLLEARSTDSDRAIQKWFHNLDPLVFICEDAKLGFLSCRVERSESDDIVLTPRT